MGQLYLFANECPTYANEENWKTCLGRVCNRYNTLKSHVIGIKTSNSMFRMSRRDKPTRYSWDMALTNSILLVRLAKSNSVVGSCMFYFRAFELNVNAMKPLYSMLHTGNFVFDNEVKTGLIPFGRENKEAYSLVYYDNTCDAYGVSAAEEVAEQDSSYM